MINKRQQECINECYPHLLRELNIRENLKTNTDGNEDTISPSEILNFLLENRSLSENVIRSAARTIRHERTKAKTSVNSAEASGFGNVTQANAGMKVSKLVPENSLLTAGRRTSTCVNRTRHIALRFFYDGATYSGLAQNVGLENDNSVERFLFDALLKARLIVSRESSNYSRCGRTDRGVSSAGQVVALNLKSAFPSSATWDKDGTSIIKSLDLPKNEHESRKVWTIPRSKRGKKQKNLKPNNDIDGVSEQSEVTPMIRVEREINEYSYSKILNNILPPSIRILGWTPVTDDFSARFSAGSRTYRYFFCKRRMDLNKIQEGLNRLVGNHDFRNFCKMDVEKVYNFKRHIHSAEVIEAGDPNMMTNHGEIFYLKIVGQAFLWHQIRCIAKVIFMIGNGFESPDIITELLDVKKNPGKPGYSLANEKPLVLYDCGYPNLHFGYTVQNLWTVSCQLEKQWEDLILAAIRIRSGIESLGSCSILTEDLIEFANSRLKDLKNKRRRKGIYTAGFKGNHTSIDDAQTSSKVITWCDALTWLEKQDLVPCPNGLTNSVHVPLMQRSMGPSYEEKIENLKKSEKRLLKFEENIIKKRKTAEEDKAFYHHKQKQGGTGI